MGRCDMPGGDVGDFLILSIHCLSFRILGKTLRAIGEFRSESMFFESYMHMLGVKV